MIVTQRERETETETQAEGEAGSLQGDLDPGSPGSCPGPKSGTKTAEPPRRPKLTEF